MSTTYMKLYKEQTCHFPVPNGMILDTGKVQRKAEEIETGIKKKKTISIV